MIIYRGVKDILFSKINPFHLNSSFHTYGAGTSYSESYEQATEYANIASIKKFGWVLEYLLVPQNPEYITEKNYLDLENFAENTDLFYDNHVIESNQLSDLVRNKGHDCIIFDYDDSDGHVIVLRESDLTLTNLMFITDDARIIKFLNQFELPKNDDYFVIPLELVPILDDFLELDDFLTNS